MSNSDGWGEGTALGNERSHPTHHARREHWVAELIAVTEELAGDGREIGLLRELAEADVAAHDTFIHAYMTCDETSNAAREHVASFQATQYRDESTRLKAKVDAAKVRHSTLITLLSLP